MDLRNIQTFIRVSELGSFTKAAQELGYVQSTITMQIQQLEKELGFPLFDRVGKRISLSPMGSEFLEHAYKIMQSIWEASNLGRDTAELHGMLRVGVLESLLFSNMLQLLPRFKNCYKNMDLQIKMGQASDLLHQLKENQLDMVYLSAGLNTDPDLCCYYKRRENLIFVCGSNHAFAKEHRVNIQKLLSQDFIVTEHSGICYGRLRELAERYDSVLRSSVELDSTIAIAALLQENTALTFLPEYSVQKQLQEGSLVRVDVDLEPQVYYSQILGHKKHWVSPFMAGLIGEIRNAFPERE